MELKYDILTRNFLNTSASGKSDKSLRHEVQDPTFLTFKIDFFPDAGASLTKQDFTPFGGLLRKPSASTDNRLSGIDFLNKDSASEYLKNIGSPSKFGCLELFIDMLKDINDNMPWYFQKISGMGELYKFNMSEGIRVKNDVYLTIECLESVDRKMAYMSDLYRTAAFDLDYMREVIPHNLRTFDMDIHILEFRNFNTTFGNIAAMLRGDVTNPLTGKTIFDAIKAENYNQPILQSMFEAISVETFRLRACEFDFNTEAPAYYESLSVDDIPEATYKFKIKVGEVEKTGVYPFFDAVISDVVNKTSLSYKAINKALNDNNRNFNTIIEKTIKGKTFTKSVKKLQNTYDENGIIIDQKYEETVETATSTSKLKQTVPGSMEVLTNYYDNAVTFNRDNLTRGQSLKYFRDYRNAIFPTIYGDELSQDARILHTDENLGTNTLPDGTPWPHLNISKDAYKSGGNYNLDPSADSVFTNNRIEDFLTRNIKNKAAQLANGVGNQISGIISQAETNIYNSVGELTGGLIGQPDLGNVFSSNDLLNSIKNSVNSFLNPSMQASSTPINSVVGKNIGFTPNTPDNKITETALKGATPIVGISDDPLSGTKPDDKIVDDQLVGKTPTDAIVKDDLTGSSPNDVIIKDDLMGNSPSSNIEKDDLVGKAPDNNILKDDLIGKAVNNAIISDDLVGNKPGSKIISDDLYGSTPSNKILDDNLKGNSPDKKILDASLKGNSPDKNILTDNLKGNIPDIKILDDTLVGNKSSNSIEEINLKGNRPTENIEEDNLKGNNPTASFISNELKGINPSDSIVPILLEGEPTNKNIFDISLKGTTPKKEIIDDKLSGVNPVGTIDENVLERSQINSDIDTFAFDTRQTATNEQTLPDSIIEKSGYEPPKVDYDSIKERILKRLNGNK